MQEQKITAQDVQDAINFILDRVKKRGGDSTDLMVLTECAAAGIIMGIAKGGAKRQLAALMASNIESHLQKFDAKQSNVEARDGLY